MTLSQLLSLPVLATASGLLFAYLVTLIIHRLYFSPIAHFPGPKIAALTSWYEFYYDVMLHGQYIFRVKKMHEIYGPIIRINPYEIHVSNLDFIDELFAGSGRKRDKWEWVTSQLGEGITTLTTGPHDIHRVRRAAINPFFSKASVRSLQPLIDRKIQLLFERIADFKKTKEVLTFNLALAAFTNDVVTEYSFGYCHDRLKHHDFDHAYHDSMMEGFAAGHLLKHIPLVRYSLEVMPLWLLPFVAPAYDDYIKEQKAVMNDANNVIETRQGSSRMSESRTIYSDILDSKLPPKEKSPHRLSEESTVTIAAGTLTTAWTISVITYYLLVSPLALHKLRDELALALQDSSSHIPLTTVEALPYLTACLKEALRLSYCVTDRLSRIAQDEEMLFRDGKKTWKIPKGVPTSMTIPLMNHDETIFPDSHTFRPERWIEDPHLDHYLLSFGRGTRICLGINLAWAELYLTVAALFRNYGSVECRKDGDLGILQLHETNHMDVQLAADNIVPTMWKGTKGIRILVKDG